MSERRRTERRRGSGLTARVRPGHRVAVIDVSTGGALLEATSPLRPGTDVEVQFERAEGRLRVSATVLRCGVSALDPHRGPTYRAAVSFADSFEWAREPGTPHGHDVPARRSLAGGRTHK